MSVENHDSSNSEPKPQATTETSTDTASEPVSETGPEDIEAGSDVQAAQEPAEPLTELELLQQQLAEAQAKADDHWDQLLRAQAEMENMRKRTEREVSQARKYGLESIARELLPIHDSLGLGVAELVKEDASVEHARDGMMLITQMMGKLMEQFSIKEINPEGEAFDPEAHQAMTMQETAEQAPNTVIQVLQKGYRLNERVLRPAMVIVAKAPEANAEPESNGDS